MSYIDHRKREPVKPRTSLNQDRSSPSGAAREGPFSLLSGFGGLSNLPKSGSGRFTSQAGRTSLPATLSQSDRPPAGKPTRNSSPGGQFKSHSFNNGESLLSAALSGSNKLQAPASPARAGAAGRAGFPVDLGASLTRRSAALQFRPSAALSVSMPPVPTRPRTSNNTAAPAENTFVLDDCTITFGHSSFQGQRDYQEDTVAVLTTPNCFLGGVFDGHGGDEVSKELERVLLQNMNRKVAESLVRGPEDPRAVEGAIRQSYINTNEEIAQRMEKAQEAGSCAVTALVRRVGGRTYLFCANAGDCRAVLYTQGPTGPKRAVRLSEDHKPHPNVAPSEITRICDAGGCVLWGRVQGCLAVSRAFGDRTLQPYVIADPHIEARPLDPDNDMFVYLASDGVTDMIDDQQGCTLIAEQFARGANTAQAASALVSAAYHKGSCDNISVLVMRIRRRQPGDVNVGAG